LNTNNRNNNNNNRRRGRNNSRGQSGGGGSGNQGNRIDSRARGNAAQMLEKYRKMAHDASLNGDRVQTEYFLQFADHYFRVQADSKSPRDDQRARNPNDRDQQVEDEFDDGEEEMDPRFRRHDPNADRERERERERERDRQADREQGRDRDHDQDRDQDQDRSDDGAEVSNRPRRSEPRNAPRPDRNRGSDQGQGRNGSSDRDDDGNRTSGDRAQAASGNEAGDSNEVENPFLREERPRRPRRARSTETDAAPPADRGDESGNGFDAGILPPSIARDEAPAPKRATRARKPKKSEDGDAETLEAVG
jgi:hypothetical protein